MITYKNTLLVLATLIASNLAIAMDFLDTGCDSPEQHHIVLDRNKIPEYISDLNNQEIDNEIGIMATWDCLLEEVRSNRLKNKDIVTIYKIISEKSYLIRARTLQIFAVFLNNYRKIIPSTIVDALQEFAEAYCTNQDATIRDRATMLAQAAALRRGPSGKSCPTIIEEE